MATVGEVLRSVSRDFVVLAGAAGLGREVRRILLVGPPGELTASPGRGDLVVYAQGDSAEAADRVVTILVSEGVAGVLSDLAPTVTAIQTAEVSGSPLVAPSAGIDPEELYSLLVRALEQQRAALDTLQAELHVDFARLVRAGGTPAMLLERVVEVTGKTGVLQATETSLETVRQPVLQDLETAVIRRAIDTSSAAVQRWMLESADASIANVLYLELPADQLVRLVAPVWVGGRTLAALSLFARSDELRGRDRVALVAAARAIAAAYAEIPAHTHVTIPARPYGAVVIQAHDASLQRVGEAVRQRFEPFRGAMTVGREDVRACLPYESQAQWSRQLAECHAQLSADLGTVSLGHAVRSGAESTDPQSTLVQAAEALLLGDHLFGPGHITSYADAQLARFLLGSRQTHELRALYEQAVGKLAADDLKLVSTLEAYCETFSTQGTADRLGIHRNTVLYRLKLIEEITAVDLDDGSSRLFLQLGLLAGRLARRSSGSRLFGGTQFGGPHLIKVGRRTRTPHARTA